MARKSQKKRGGGWFGADEKGPGPLASLSKLNPFASATPAPAPPPVALVDSAVKATTDAAQVAGKRVKKHLGVNPVSPKDARKLLKTAKGDKMLGRKRKTVKRRRS